jgi:hypothetical protein
VISVNGQNIGDILIISGETMITHKPKLSELSVLHPPPISANNVESLVLISHRDHIDQLSKCQDRLVVSTDWLAWRHCLDKNIPCIHYESMLGDWPSAFGDPDNLYRRSCQWMYDGKTDTTLFRGVSLGKLFNNEMSLIVRSYNRFWISLDRTCASYEPKRIEFYDIRGDMNQLDEGMKTHLVTDVADRYGIEVIDFGNRRSDDRVGQPDFNLSQQIVSPPFWKRAIREIVLWIINHVTRLQVSAPRRSKRILFNLNWLVMSNLLNNISSSAIRPVLFAQHHQKSLGFLFYCLRLGITLVHPSRKRLNNRDQNSVNEIINNLKANWESSRSGADEVCRQFVLNHVLSEQRLFTKAAKVRQMEQLFSDAYLDRIIVGDAESDLSQLLLGLAAKNSVPVDEFFNGMFMENQRYDARSGDDYRSGLVGRLLSWGKQNEQWWRAVGGSVEIARIGYPAFESIKKFPRRNESTSRNVLVLPIAVDRSDILGLRSNIFTTLVDTVLALKASGYKSIRIKLHHGTINKHYYEDLVQYFGLDCKIIQDGIVVDQLDWADLVIGPVNSGALLESLAAEVPYYPIVMTPTSLRDEHFGPIHVYRSVADMITEIKAGIQPNYEEILEYFCSTHSIPNAAKRFWEVMEASKISRPKETAE